MGGFEQAHEKDNEFNLEKILETLNEESFEELLKKLEKLGTPEKKEMIEEIEKILEKEEEMLKGRIREIYEPEIKNKYIKLLQALRISCLAKVYQDNQASIQVEKEYHIQDSKGTGIDLISYRETRESGDINEIKYLDREGQIPYSTINNDFYDNKCFGNVCCITEKECHCYVNVKLLTLEFKERDETQNVLYISGIYVDDFFIGNKDYIGNQLLIIAEEIAQKNSCSKIFTTIIPEKSFVDMKKYTQFIKKDENQIEITVSVKNI